MSTKDILKAVLKGLPLEIAVPAFMEWAIDSIKTPAAVKRYSKVFIALRDALLKKYPLENTEI
jgi:hypothetical protein